MLIEHPRLLVFFGLPGCGKSTLIAAAQKRLPGFAVTDIFEDYIKPHLRRDGKETGRYPFAAYENIFTDMRRAPGPRLLEMGTNYAAYTARRLSALQQHYRVQAVLCMLPPEICFQRVQKRKRGVPFHPEKLQERLQRPFRTQYRAALGRYGIPMHEVDMRLPLTRRVRMIHAYAKT